MMKRVMMAGMALLFGVSCNTPEVLYRISGSLPGVEDGTPVELTGIGTSGKDSLLISGSVTGGKFEIPVSERYDMAYLSIPEKQQRIPVFFEPGVEAYVLEAGSDGRFRMKGGLLQDLWENYKARNGEFQARKESFKSVGKRLAREEDLFKKMHRRAIYEEIVAAQEQFEDSLLRQNDNIVAAAIVWMRGKELGSKHMLGDKMGLLGPNARQTTPGKALQQMAERQFRTENGNIAPDFTQNDPEGNPISLHGIRAKVKILDFWASWCGPCRAEAPNIRHIYEKYKDAGLEIISVSLDTKRENWEQAIQEDGMKWLHTSDLQGWENAVAQLYGIRSVPTIFVLDEENRIIGQNLRGKELEEVVEQVLGE